VLPFIGIVEQALKLINNLLEGTPPEVRFKQAQIWFELWRPILVAFIPEDRRETLAKVLEQVDEI